MSKSQTKVLFFVIPALFVQLVGAYFYFVIAQEAYLSQLIYTGTKLTIIILPLIFYLKFRGLFSLSKLPNQKPQNKKSIMFGILAGIFMSLLIFSVYLFLRSDLARYSTEIIAKVESFGIENHYIMFAIFLSVIHSFVEEFYWRWFIFGGLKLKLSPLWAALVGSLAFSAHHFIVLGAFFPIWLTIAFGSAVFFAGLIWCLLYFKTNSLYGSWISHIFADMSVMGIIYLLIT